MVGGRSPSHRPRDPRGLTAPSRNRPNRAPSALENRGTLRNSLVYPKTGAHRHSAGAPGGTMIRIRWAVFAIALGCLLSVGRPVAASASLSAEATSLSAQGLRAANARVAHAERTAPQNRTPARRHPATPAHRSSPSHTRIARHRSRTHQPNPIDWNDRNFATLPNVERMSPDRFRAQMGETERALGSRGPPRASPPVKIARVESPPSSAVPSVLSVSSAHCIRAPPPHSLHPSPVPELNCFTHAVRLEGTAVGSLLPSGDFIS